MFSVTDWDINVEQLMHEIRATVTRRQNESVPEVPETSPTRQISSNGREALLRQPEFQPDSNNRYHVNDFLKYHGATFVHNAYLGLLKRPPDQSGSERFLAALASGNLNKLDVLARLHYSDEGKQAGVKVAGLTVPAFIRKLQRVPYVGHAFAVAIAVVRLPLLHKNIRKSEFDFFARQEQLIQQFERAHQQMSQNFQEAIGDLTQIVAEQQRAIADQQRTDTALTERQQQFEKQQTALRADAEHFREEAIGTMEKLGKSQQVFDDRLLDMERQAKNWSLDELYAAFEDEFRGEREEIKSRLEVYLPILRDAGITADVLDLGCGRGEWLELLRDQGIEAYGVDHNATFINRCRELGLNVVEADVTIHLQNLSTASLSLVTGFHIVEHLPIKELVGLIDETLRVLKQGGVVIFETPNPENFMVGSHTFYTDPTHRNPIPNATLKFLLEMRGFEKTEVMKLRPWTDVFIPGDSELVKRFNEYFYSAPDYAVVARKL